MIRTAMKSVLVALLVFGAAPAFAQRTTGELDEIRMLLRELQERIRTREREEDRRREVAVDVAEERGRARPEQRHPEPPRSFLLEFSTKGHAASVAVTEGEYHVDAIFNEEFGSTEGRENREQEEGNHSERQISVQGVLVPDGDWLRVEFSGSTHFQEQFASETVESEEKRKTASQLEFHGSCVLRPGEDTVIARNGEMQEVRLRVQPLGERPRERARESREEPPRQRDGLTPEQRRILLLKALGAVLEE